MRPRSAFLPLLLTFALFAPACGSGAEPAADEDATRELRAEATTRPSNTLAAQAEQQQAAVTNTTVPTNVPTQGSASASTSAPAPTNTAAPAATATPVPPTATKPPPTAVPPTAIPPTATKAANCRPAYPTVCIPPAPPDLDCKDISYKRFTVLPPDPHGFDGNDNDGLGCES